MKKANLQVSFDADKLNALRFYMQKKEMNVEDELQDHISKFYQKVVPAQVREYVESQSETPKQEIKTEEKNIKQKNGAGDNIAKQKSKTNVEKGEKPSTKQEKHQREKDIATTQTQQEKAVEPEKAKQETQGMSMSM